MEVHLIPVRARRFIQPARGRCSGPQPPLSYRDGVAVKLPRGRLLVIARSVPSKEIRHG